MSWHFSRALVVAFWEDTSSAGARSALLSGSPTQPLFLPSDRTTAFSRLSRFGMTFGPLTADLGAELLTWFLAASRARTSASQERAQESTASAPACGPTWRGSLAKFDPDSRSWRTAQLSLLGDSGEFSPTWPRSGMTAGGLCWELPMSGRRISATGSGLWVPTPIRNDAEKRGNFDPIRSWGLAGFAKLWPTPLANSHTGAGHGPNKTGAPNLQTMVKLWPTPSCIGINGGSNSRAAALKRGSSAQEVNSGSLNPTWVEWLMHWPLNWTSLEPLANEQFDKWSQDGSAVVRGDRMRPVWFDAEPTQAPQGPKPVQQRAEQCGDSLRAMPRIGAQTTDAGGMQGLRNDIHAEALTEGDCVQPGVSFGMGEVVGGETLVPRVASGVTARVDRLKALGNGQVPLCAAEAWRMLAARD